MERATSESKLGRRLFAEDAAQDLVEYALLLMFFGVLVLATWNSIQDAVRANYRNGSSGVQSLWEAPEPGAR
jgi:hypothetical protein